MNATENDRCAMTIVDKYSAVLECQETVRYYVKFLLNEDEHDAYYVPTCTMHLPVYETRGRAVEAANMRFEED